MPECLLLFLFILPLNLSAQQNFWRVLSEVSFKTITTPNGYEVEKPQFSEHLRSFDGKTIKIKGYIIPLNEINGKPAIMLSSLPFNVCYFCGGAGPETVIEVETSENIKFTTKAVTLEGNLELNDNDPDHHIYILKSAKLTQQ